MKHGIVAVSCCVKRGSARALDPALALRPYLFVAVVLLIVKAVQLAMGAS